MCFDRLNNTVYFKIILVYTLIFALRSQSFPSATVIYIDILLKMCYPFVQQYYCKLYGMGKIGEW